MYRNSWAFGEWSDGVVESRKIKAPFLHHSPALGKRAPCLTLLPKPIYLNASTLSIGARLGTHRPQRNQSHHRFDEKERPFGLRDRKERLSSQAPKGTSESNNHTCAADYRFCAQISNDRRRGSNRDRQTERYRFAHGRDVLPRWVAGRGAVC